MWRQFRLLLLLQPELTVSQHEVIIRQTQLVFFAAEY